MYVPSIQVGTQVIIFRFFDKYGMPGVIGCVDGTHVAIVPPKNQEHIYVNRKNYHSINTQLVSTLD